MKTANYFRETTVGLGRDESETLAGLKAVGILALVGLVVIAVVLVLV